MEAIASPTSARLSKEPLLVPEPSPPPGLGGRPGQEPARSRKGPRPPCREGDGGWELVAVTRDFKPGLSNRRSFVLVTDTRSLWGDEGAWSPHWPSSPLCQILSGGRVAGPGRLSLPSPPSGTGRCLLQGRAAPLGQRLLAEGVTGEHSVSLREPRGCQRESWFCEPSLSPHTLPLSEDSAPAQPPERPRGHLAPAEGQRARSSNYDGGRGGQGPEAWV